MSKPDYFYSFLTSMSRELAFVARELEHSIFTSPRTMLTHARVFVETILEHVMSMEGFEELPRTNLKIRLDLLDKHGYLTPDIRDALHVVRQLGNKAAHDARRFRYSEALASWEALYVIVRWYVEVYGPIKDHIPAYEDPLPPKSASYDIAEIEQRLLSLEKQLKKPLNSLNEELAVTQELPEVNELPGFTTTRTLHYKDQSLDIPHFLRDSFLLPQRFAKSATFLIRLGAEQQARIMSELPTNLSGLHTYVKRFNEKNDETLFEELKVYVVEEKMRRQLVLDRPGELFLFFQSRHIVITEELANIDLTVDHFHGVPSLINQLNADEMTKVGQLPKELVILAKYTNVGIGTVEKLFDQLISKQG